ncbi:MAG TPA: hypothetical protein DD738_15975 [Ruminiclostridium sp.]|jgi:GntR family transcriptional repressor for pyruvate dehydrogenase complex|nr:hypothetical protein [Ruminiclostridium sp.]
MKYVEKVKSRTKCDRVVDQIKDLIIRGVYKSGDKLPAEAALCEMFDVSRITIRESLKKMNMMGLVDIKQGKGTYVKTVDLSTFMKPMFQLINFEEIDVETIYNAREIIEGGTAYLAAMYGTEEECKLLGDILSDFKSAVQGSDITVIRGLDTDFHIQIAKMSHNTLLQACVCTIEEINQACVKRISKFFVTLEASYADHHDIYEQILSKDPEGARMAMVKHTIASKEVLIK